MTRLRSLRSLIAATAAAAALAAGCGGARKPYTTTGGALQLSKVVLYRNGVGYFERGGKVSGDTLAIRVRKDQVNDLLKSLTVVERKGGRAVSISMPLDPRTWANAAIATLGPGSGSLAEILDKLRGTEVTLRTADGSISGRVLIVEAIVLERSPDPDRAGPAEQDFKVTLIRGGELAVVKLSKVTGIALHNEDISMQFQRSLDATAGEGMFQQVDVTIRLAGGAAHDLIVSYVVGAPMWKPTYRIVLPEGGKGQALLQGWAVVDNTTGEDWRDVKLSLTSGAPIAFRYDLHTPRDVARTDLSAVGSARRAQAAVGEAGYAQPGAPAAEPSVARAEEQTRARFDSKTVGSGGGGRAAAVSGPRRPMPVTTPTPPPPPPKISSRDMDGDELEEMKNEVSAVDAGELARSIQATAQAANVSGLSRYDLGERLTVPDGTSTMVAIINQQVEGEETFLFRPGGGGSGYEANPYRVIRFKNSTPFALESGPISIYAGGSFVGEGISQPVSAGVAVTIPFAVESSFLVASRQQYSGDEVRLIKIVRGVIEIENFSRRTTTWEVKSQQPREAAATIYVRHPRLGGNYELAPRPPGTEDLPDAYMIPIQLAAKATEAKLDVVEQTPARSTLSIWDSRSVKLFEGILAQGNLDPAIRQKLAPVVKLRQEIGRIDTEIEGKTRTRGELDQRAQETRSNLEAIKKDPAAGELRKRLSDRLDQFSKDGDKLGRELVELQTKRTEKKVALEDLMQNLDLTPAKPLAPKA